MSKPTHTTAARTAIAVAALAVTLLASCTEAPAPSGNADARTTSDRPQDNSTLDDRVLYTRVALAASRVRTVHVRGVVRVGKRTIRTDLRYDLGTRNYTVTVEEVGVGAFDVVSVDSELYLNGDAGTWSRVEPGLAARLTGKYVRLPADSPLVAEPNRIKGLADTRALAEGIEESERQGDVEVEGRRMIVLSSHDDALGDVRLYLPAEGNLLPTRLTMEDRADIGVTLDWLDFDRPVTVQRPSADRIVELPGQPRV
ncbi:hypothetical protein ACFZBU_11510 [Embleya sp. NPDC008237]|uniref:hypothetical protein n=1 Tax=Embleya sp. NPDC008237 TaxID=3363978 RepID=UPI0036E795B5